MTPFASLPRTPLEHFRLHVYGALLLLRRAFPRPEEAPGLAGFLGDYYDELDRAGFGAADGVDGWWAAVEDWDADAHGELPLARLRRVAELDPASLGLLFTIALPEEDSRFALLAEAAGAPDRRVTVGLVSAWWGPLAAADVGASLRRLRALGLVEVGNPLRRAESGRCEWRPPPGRRCAVSHLAARPSGPPTRRPTRCPTCERSCCRPPSSGASARFTCCCANRLRAP